MTDTDRYSEHLVSTLVFMDLALQLWERDASGTRSTIRFNPCFHGFSITTLADTINHTPNLTVSTLVFMDLALQPKFFKYDIYDFNRFNPCFHGFSITTAPAYARST